MEEVKYNIAIRIRTACFAVVALFMVVSTASVSAQISKDSRYKIVGGVLKEAQAAQSDSLAGLVGDSLGVALAEVSSSVIDAGAKPELKLKGGTEVRYSRLFKDTIPISRMTAISLVLPGFGQVYNKQAWKLPAVYGITGGLAIMGFNENSKYKSLKTRYDKLVLDGASQEEIDLVQSPMIKKNTTRTLLLGGALVSYIYFVSDGVLNYNGSTNSVKIATTLSTICPGAGQIYNKSYWKAPIVIGGFATMAFIIDSNTRGYDRFKLAYDLKSAEKPNVNDPGLDNWSADQLKRIKNNYRRNRDLSYIITAGFYLLNIIDAHSDAHMKGFDVSDDLVSVKLTPSIDRINIYNGPVYYAGMNLSISF